MLPYLTTPQERLIYGDYMVPGAEPTVYEEVPDLDKLTVSPHNEWLYRRWREITEALTSKFSFDCRSHALCNYLRRTV